jgi:hypothetical protein
MAVLREPLLRSLPSMCCRSLVGLDGAPMYLSADRDGHAIREVWDDITMSYDLPYSTPLESTL